ncbi:RNA polymerase-associated protein CTR9 homolog [Drosophila ficusphila]|uniref:RNA polymerase-associated protein CTR9 homolog n=1 Tax=Drosophila ficusphila TaxID=30025 RepID=UPI0007E7F4BA|nr:RNA polymerase-associated protein CTR9 homolog [Drosophila ficusphila]
MALQAKIRNLLQEMDELEQPGYPHAKIIKGFALMLSLARAQDADLQFISVLSKDSKNIPSLIGRGCLAFNRQDYIGSLGFFKSVLMIDPRGPADVRVGIAHCFLKLGELDSARRFFEMALAQNGKCVNALLGLAMLKLNQREKQSTQEGMNLICAAFELNNHNPVVLSILAAHFYFVRNHKMVLTLAANGFKHTDIPELQAQNCFQIARSFHATGQFSPAKKFYQLSVKLAPKGYVLPQMGLAQMHLRCGESDKAKICLETFLKFMPDEPNALRLLAKLYLSERSPGQVDKAIEMLLKVVKIPFGRQDYDSWLSLAFAYEQKENFIPAIFAYHEAMRIYADQGLQIPIEWLNNLAATQWLAKKPEEALKTLDDAIEKCKLENGDHNVTNLLTMHFNRGRILEDLNNIFLAAKMYNDITLKYPQHNDCFLRLGILAMQRNKLIRAIEFFKCVLAKDSDDFLARTYMADCFMKMNCSKKAVSYYNLILRNSSEQNDTYTMLAMGNFCLKKVQNSKGRKNSFSNKQLLLRALKCYAKVLECNPRNLWAANGIGAILSFCKKLSEGEVIFKQILGAGKCFSALLNSAHIALKLGQFKQASQTYKQCLEECLPEKRVEVIHYLARSLYGEENAGEAKMWLIKARHLAPQDPSLLFNLALTIKENSKQIFGNSQPRFEELKRAELELKVALNYFDHLYLNQSEILVRACAKGAKVCQKLLNKLPEALQRVRLLELSADDRIRLQEERLRALQEQQKEQSLRKQEEERLLLEKKISERQKVLERSKKIMAAGLEDKPSEPKSKNSKKGGKKRQKEPNPDGKSDDSSGEKPAKKSRKKQNKLEKTRKAKDVKAPENDCVQKYKSKEFISSEEDSSGDDKMEKNIESEVENQAE